MTEAERPLLALLVDSLRVKTDGITVAESTLYAAARWLRAIEGPRLGEVASAATGASTRTYHTVATIGFCLGSGLGDSGVEQSFRDGLAWMGGRQFFPPSHTWQFEVDSLAMLGIAVGMQTLAVPQEARKWLIKVIDRSLADTKPDEWDASLRCAARAIATNSGTAQVRADVLAALSSLGLMQMSSAQEDAARLLIVDSATTPTSLAHAAVQLVALRWLLRSAALAIPDKASVDDLVRVLEALPHALKRWPWEAQPRTTGQTATPQKWDIQNEYHVQSLLWAILVPLFPDLEDEEWLRSKGHKHPRADLAVPSLGLIVEVKYLRGGSPADCSKLIGEIAQDSGLYLSRSSEFKRIVAFIWDESRSTDQHKELTNGLMEIDGVEAAVVVCRPGGWEYSDPSDRGTVAPGRHRK